MASHSSSDAQHICEYCRKNRLGINTSPSFEPGEVGSRVSAGSFTAALFWGHEQCKTRAWGAVGRCSQKQKTRVFTEMFDWLFFPSKEQKKAPQNTYSSTHNRLAFINLSPLTKKPFRCRSLRLRISYTD